MTLVVVKRQRKDVIVLADTMTSNMNLLRHDIIPGRVTIGPRFTVAFAGDADPASVAVRKAFHALRDEGRKSAIEFIRKDNLRDFFEYIVVSHDTNAQGCLMRHGASVAIDDICAIGIEEPFRTIIDEERLAGRDPDMFDGRLRLRSIDNLLTQRYVAEGTGGFQITLVATPQQQRFLAVTGGYTYKFDIVWGATTEQSWEQVEGGGGHYHLTVMASDFPNVPLVGACLFQAKLGYIYSPIERPEPLSVVLLTDALKWEGHEHEIFAALKVALEKHVNISSSQKDLYSFLPRNRFYSDKLKASKVKFIIAIMFKRIRQTTAVSKAAAHKQPARSAGNG